jgi:hypothetical protein
MRPPSGAATPGTPAPPGAEESKAYTHQGRRIAHAVVLVVAVAFVGDSALQIIPAVFGLGIRQVPAGPPGSPELECVQGVFSLARALDRASADAWSPRAARAVTQADDDPAIQAFRSGLLPEWSAEAKVENACAQSREGLEAWAALVRLRRAEEQVVVHSLVELIPLRRDVEAHLPADLR